MAVAVWEAREEIEACRRTQNIQFGVVCVGHLSNPVAEYIGGYARCLESYARCLESTALALRPLGQVAGAAFQ